MAELASGAVHLLLGVIRDEAKLLGRVKSDVQFIKEEMESMNSFLHHLARTTPPGGEHDEQVRTWMKQVRDLAYACSNCIDLYLQRGDPKVYRAQGPRGYVWWVPWYLQKLFAQRRAATQLRELKARARDIGKRRLRYGVEIPGKSGDKTTTTTTLAPPITGATPSSQAAGVGDIEEEEEDDSRYCSQRRALAFAEPHILEECTQELVNWLSRTENIHDTYLFYSDDKFPAIAIVSPDKEDGADVAHEALAHPSVAAKFEQKLWITFEWFCPSPSEILEEILKKLLPDPPEPHYEWPKTKKLERKIEEIAEKTEKHLQAVTKRSRVVVPLEPLDILRDILQELLPEPVGQDQTEEKIEETAEKIKVYLESGQQERSRIGLDHHEYVGILQELLPQPKEDKQKQVKEATDISGDDQIAKNIKEILRGLIPKPQEDKSVKEEMDKLGEDQIAEKFKETTEKIIVNKLRELLPKPKEDSDKLDEDQAIEEITEKIIGILDNIRTHMLIKEIAEKIKEHLKGKRTLLVLHLDHVCNWGETKRALNMLGCATGSAVVVTTKYTQGASQYCNPTWWKTIEYSFVGFYHDKAIRLTSRHVNEDPNYNANIYRHILKKCEPHEFCMKIFAHALYANPNRSKQELDKLNDTLVFGGSLDTNARKMLKFTYRYLPRDYKACLLYLAIFPRGWHIRRSSLVGRWVAEGLVTKEDWPSSVHEAERCFDALIDLWLVYPGDVGATGKVKSCIVHGLVYDFITKIARKERFVETRLSHRLAHHFSVLSDVRLRSSDNIEEFLKKLYRIPQLPLVKVLDLESCPYFKKNQHYLKNIFKNQHYIKNIFKNQHYLKNICNKMLLLKYLSLRNTDITNLPKEINKLHQLEVLDIRHTHVMTASATKHLVLLKLKRLLAGCTHPSPSCTIKANKSFSAARLPHRIGKMTNMEVLSHVEASQRGADQLKDIGKLWQLRKLGVVIPDKKAHLENLVQVISDLSESLRSLAIGIKPLQASSHGTPSNTDISFKDPPKLLESLSISGNTTSGHYTHLVKHCDGLAKVTLHNTHLNQENMKDLGKLAKLRCVRLRHESYTESNLTFKKEEFQNLKYLLVEGSNMTDISFEDGAAPELEKIVLSLADMNNISFGIGAVTQLEKIVLSSINIASITFANGAAPKLNEIALSFTKITSITFENGATPNLKKIIFGDTAAPQLEKIVLSSTITGITFKNGAAPKLEEIVLSSTSIASITFENGATPNLKKIVLSFTDMESLSGIDNLSMLKEIEFSGDNVPDKVRETIAAHPNHPVLKPNPPQNQVQATGSAAGLAP